MSYIDKTTKLVKINHFLTIENVLLVLQYQCNYHDRTYAYVNVYLLYYDPSYPFEIDINCNRGKLYRNIVNQMYIVYQ